MPLILSLKINICNPSKSEVTGYPSPVCLQWWGYIVVILNLFRTVVYVEAALPQLPDCQRLEDHVLDSANPIDVFGANQEIGQRAVPVRNANLRSRGPIPTHHFATSQIKVKDRPEPLRIFPYEGKPRPTMSVSHTLCLNTHRHETEDNGKM